MVILLSIPVYVFYVLSSRTGRVFRYNVINLTVTSRDLTDIFTMWQLSALAAVFNLSEFELSAEKVEDGDETLGARRRWGPALRMSFPVSHSPHL